MTDEHNSLQTTPLPPSAVRPVRPDSPLPWDPTPFDPVPIRFHEAVDAGFSKEEVIRAAMRGELRLGIRAMRWPARERFPPPPVFGPPGPEPPRPPWPSSLDEFVLLDQGALFALMVDDTTAVYTVALVRPAGLVWMDLEGLMEGVRLKHLLIPGDDWEGWCASHLPPRKEREVKPEPATADRVRATAPSAPLAPGGSPETVPPPVTAKMRRSETITLGLVLRTRAAKGSTKRHGTFWNPVPNVLATEVVNVLKEALGEKKPPPHGYAQSTLRARFKVGLELTSSGEELINALEEILQTSIDESAKVLGAQAATGRVEDQRVSPKDE